MAIITVPGQPAEFAFRRKAQPKARAKAGDRVRFETSDALYAAMSGAKIDFGDVDFQKVNALSGPIWVEGAQAGDALGIRVEEIELDRRAFAVYVARWRQRMFGLPESRVVRVTVENDWVNIGNGRRITVRPMIGCIGVAPGQGSVSALSPTSRTGGNMDLLEIAPGTTIWFPVEVEGGLLSLGDLHARMGRGEAVGSGLECAGAVTGTLLVGKTKSIQGPMYCDGKRIGFVGTSPDDWGDAEAAAVRAAWGWLTMDGDVSIDDALVICAALLDVDNGGPAGNNVVASFPISELGDAGVNTNVWPINAAP
jgi:amidase